MAVDAASDGDPTPLRLVLGDDGDGEGEGLVLDGRDPHVAVLAGLDDDNET
jgi:hypothetical protein